MTAIKRLNARAEEGRGCNLKPEEAAEIQARLDKLDEQLFDAEVENNRLRNKRRQAQGFRNVRPRPMRLSVVDTPACLRSMSSKFAEAARAAASPFQVDHKGLTPDDGSTEVAVICPEL